MREENIRHAGWAGAVGYGLLALFELLWLTIGLFFHSYDFGGVVRDQLVRSAVFM